jgi:hypothetical protein
MKPLKDYDLSQWDESKTIKEMAVIMGVSKQLCYNVAHSRGLNFKNGHSERLKFDVKLWNPTKSKADNAKIQGMSYPSLDAWIRKLNLEYKRKSPKRVYSTEWYIERKKRMLEALIDYRSKHRETIFLDCPSEVL